MSGPVAVAATPEPPYYAVIFTSLRTEGDNGYGEMAARMAELVAQQPGYLGMESAREGLGITVCYWKDPASIEAWRTVEEHLLAQKYGHERWYKQFAARICKVERAYGGPKR
ncbi:MAG: antibiotic biosynthesis monooxygenase [Candidatus Koribacter versatilis]|uniref:Antibiotic biosynthesis monooxygenase n=1 Tax=Candidatus Korobacter versatilis TaxID=658062 RepID=A0A932EQ42_9BACT|nr:antibiotic biosynthesis monooxygenase [Candidatus Koribacter versatilis]